MSRRRKWAVGFALVILVLWAGASYLFRLKGVDIGNGWRMELVAASIDQMVYNSESTLETRVTAAMPLSAKVYLKMQPPITVNAVRQVPDGC